MRREGRFKTLLRGKDVVRMWRGDFECESPTIPGRGCIYGEGILYMEILERFFSNIFFLFRIYIIINYTCKFRNERNSCC